MGFTMKKAAALSLASLLIFGAAACGDDDDESTSSDDTSSDGSSDEEAAGDNAAFCDGLLDFQEAAFQVEVDETSSKEDIVAAGEQLSPLSTALVGSAPTDALKTSGGEIDVAVQALLEGDAEPFGSDSLFESYTAFSESAIQECDFTEVAVTGVDYAFEGAPDNLDVGTVSFAFANEGDEEHEMVIMRKADGVTESFEELLELPEEEAQTKTEFVGAAFAPPGESGSALAELTSGEYVMICFIPVGGGEDGPPHFTQGMMQTFSVS